MNNYSNNFSLMDFYTNKELAKKLPLFSYKDSVNANDKNAQIRMIADQILSFTKAGARPYYCPLRVTRKNRTIVVKGNLRTNYNSAYNGIVKSLEGRRRLLGTIIANGDVLRSAIMEDYNRREKMPKLAIRAISVSQIKQMNSNQLYGVVNDILNNILYSGNYPQTAKRLGIKPQYGVSQNNWDKIGGKG